MADSRNAAERLRETIGSQNVTQAEFARRLGVRPAYINDLIGGRRSLSEAFARRVQREFGIDPIWLRYGLEALNRKLAPPADITGGGLLVPLPLLESPCSGDPLESDAWHGSTRLLPRGLTRPSSPDRHRYVLRVTTCTPVGEVRPGDLLLVENLIPPDSCELENTWCTVRVRREVTVMKVKTSSLAAGVRIWGRCLALVWRALVPLD